MAVVDTAIVADIATIAFLNFIMFIIIQKLTSSF